MPPKEPSNKRSVEDAAREFVQQIADDHYASSNVAQKTTIEFYELIIADLQIAVDAIRSEMDE